MSSRDIDSTSENVLHDWARDEPEPDADSVEDVTGAENADAGAGTPAWGSAATSDQELEAEVEAEDVDQGRLVVEAEADPYEPEAEAVPDEPEAAPHETDVAVAPEPEPEPEPGPDAEAAPMLVELSHEHAAGDLHVPDGYAVLEGVAEGGRRAVGVVVSRFNGSVTTQLLDGALAELSAAGVRQEAITIMVVPGAFELPLAATALAKTRRFACVVALGCVIRGDTPHFDYVSSETASGIQRAALDSGVPVIFGVLTTDNEEQALARISGSAGHKGREAALTAIEIVHTMREIRGQR